MLKQPITVLVHTTVGGPNGKLVAGTIHELADDPYVRILIKSETVSLIDPPSLDPEYLEAHGYELCEGYSYPEKETKEPVSEEPISQEKGSDHEPHNVELTPPIGMGVTTSAEETNTTDSEKDSKSEGK